MDPTDDDRHGDTPHGDIGASAPTLADRVLDLVVFAPVGLVDHLVRWVPTAIAAGRDRVGTQVRTARWIGEMAVGVGRTKVRERVATVRAPASHRPSVARHEPTTAGAGAPGAAVHGGAVHGGAVQGALVAEPFPGYDSLPAAELVTMLTRLTRAELESVRAYEAAGRGRRTVLARLDQLLAA